MGVVQQLHNLHLSVNLLKVGRVQPGLVDDFDGHLEKKGGEKKKAKISFIDFGCWGWGCND